MQPRTLISATKPRAPFPTSISVKNDAPFIPKTMPKLSSKIDILSEQELQVDLTKQQKKILQQDAVNSEAELPRFAIDKVRFSVLDAETLNKMKIVNVSNKIDRDQPSEMELIASTGGFGKSSANPRCHKNDFDKLSEARLLNPNVSVTAYAQMGTVDNMKTCQTCHKTNVDCPGHLGEIKLNTMFAHPLFRDYIVMVLGCVCNSCSSLLVTEDTLIQNGIDKLSGKGRLKQINTIAAKSRCRKNDSRCIVNPTYTIVKNDDIYQIMYYYKVKTDKSIKPIKEIQTILKNISDKDAQLLGFRNGSHPKHMILESFAVIPPCARAQTIRDGVPKEDHLTIAYDEIIRDNYRYYNAPDDNKRENAAKDMYFHISHFIDNTDSKYCHSPTQYIKSIKERIVKKDGLIRSNIMGKRVNFCGRSVIGPYSKLKFGEIGIPAEMCNRLTVPEVVFSRNLGFIQDLWDKRQITHFCFDNCATEGNRYVVSEKTYKQKTADGMSVRPEIGMKVDRYIGDGDLVMVNRQPTLYKYGMPGNFIKKIDRLSIGIHMAETAMRNADFDGDEINIHVLQSLDARVEASTFANVQSCIPNALRNNAMCGILYNGLSSFYIMTRKPIKKTTENATLFELIENNQIPKHEIEAILNPVILTNAQIEEAHSLLTYKDDLDSLPKRLKKHGINPNSGSALFSSLLPATFQYTKGKVKIRDGVLVEGRIDKSHIGRAEGVIQMSIWKWYGKERAAAFLTDATYLSDWFINLHGFSFGYSDISLTEANRRKIEDVIDKSLYEVKTKIFKLGPLLSDASELEKLYREKQIYNYLYDFRTAVEKIGMEAMSPEHPLNIMSSSGAKGSGSYTNNIMGIKGQEIVGGARAERRISAGTRTLPYFDFNSEDIRSRGFIANSFTKGLTPSEMYFISESAREASISNGTNVRRSGSLHHRLIKVLEDCKVCYDGSVRNAADAIYQVGYFDGYDGGELIQIKSENAGDVITFINLQEASNMINSKYEN